MKKHKYKEILGIDLDRSLIYSGNFLNEHGYNGDVIEVEKTATNSSYITTEVLSTIRDTIDNRRDLLIVPVTSRNIQQFNRINIPGVNFKYAITTGGGKIFCNGREDISWNTLIDDMIDIDSMELLLSDMRKLQDIEVEPSVVDGVYIYTKLRNPSVCMDEIEQLKTKYSEIFDIRMDKKKVYATFRKINKGEALKYLANKLRVPMISAFGDSEMDTPMFAKANNIYIPSHNTILNLGPHYGQVHHVTGFANSMLEVISNVKSRLDSLV